MSRRSPSFQRARGFTIVELMVALVIISLGLFGIARMQAFAVSGAGISRQRSLAALEAASLASTMHANREFWAKTALTQDITVAASSITTSESSLASALIAVRTTPPPYCTGAPCTPAALAAADLSEWATELRSILPNSSARISCPATNTPTSCSIQIAWSENLVAIDAQQPDAAAGAPPAALQTPTYRLYVEP